MALKSTELRLGNFVIVNHGTDLLSKVTWIQEESVSVMFDRQHDLSNGMIASPSKIIGVPLTEEWMFRLGFIKQDDPFDWHYEINGYEVGNDFDSWTGKESRKIDYVHQLQNLYFAITGFELQCAEGKNLS